MSYLPGAAALWLAGLLMSSAWAAEPVTIANAWVRATVPGQSVAGAYFDITSAAPAALIGAGSPDAGKAELHTMTMEGDVMKMRRVEKIELPERQTVHLKPGGFHVMLIGVKHELKPGQRVTLQLAVRDAKGTKSNLEVKAEVRSAANPGQHKGH